MGRTFEHAADSKVLIDQLTQIVDVGNIKDTNVTTFFVKIIDETQVSASKDGKSIEDEKNLAEIKLAEKYQTKIFDDLKIKQEHIILNINKPFILLTMKANGKADLYFHAYFWEKYIKQLSEVSGGATSLSQLKKKKIILKKTDADVEDEVEGPLEEELTIPG